MWSLCLFYGVLSPWRAMIVFVVLREFPVSPFPFLPRRHTIRLRTADETNEPWSEMKRSRSLTPTLKRMTMRWKSQGNGLHRRSDTSSSSLRRREENFSFRCFLLKRRRPNDPGGGDSNPPLSVFHLLHDALPNMRSHAPLEGHVRHSRAALTQLILKCN